MVCLLLLEGEGREDGGYCQDLEGRGEEGGVADGGAAEGAWLFVCDKGLQAIKAVCMVAGRDSR